MNNDFDKLFGSLTPGRWDTVPDLTATVAAYLHHKKKPMQEKPAAASPRPPTVQDTIVAGVHSCLLATLVLEQGFENERPTNHTLNETAKLVLRSWGISPGEKIVAPGAAAAPPEPVLAWPPKEPGLDPVYMTHRYVVREDTVAIKGGADPELPPGGTFKAGEELVFLGAVIWDQASGCYLMRMRSLRGQYEVWVLSKDVRPGDEIEPKATPDPDAWDGP